jgi:hypothetical protein
LAALALGGCRPDAPEPAHTTTVGPRPTSATASASIFPTDTSVLVPENPAQADALKARGGAVAICGDGGVSFKHGGGACVGHGDIAEIIRH